MQKLIIITFFISVFVYNAEAQYSGQSGLNFLEGEWVLDMSPQDSSDSNFAKMTINSIDNGQLKGFFYRDGVEIRNAQINQQTKRLYCALISGDGTGEYYTTFYLENGKLYGTTHSRERNFLSVWVGRKVQ